MRKILFTARVVKGVGRQLVGVCVLLLLLTTWGQTKEVIRLTSGEWPPYTSKNLKHHGIYSHIVSEAFALEGVTVEYSFFPWKRSYLYVQKGAWDGSVTWARTPEKEKDVFFSIPVFHHTKAFFHLKSFPFNWETINDLKGIRIGTTTEYTYGEQFDRAAKAGDIWVEPVEQDINNFRKLFAERIQIFPTDIGVAHTLLNTNFSPKEIERVTYHTKPIQQTGTCVIFTKVNPERSKRLLELFNKGFIKLKESGRYDQMLKSHRQGKYEKNIK